MFIVAAIFIIPVIIGVLTEENMKAVSTIMMIIFWVAYFYIPGMFIKFSLIFVNDEFPNVKNFFLDPKTFFFFLIGSILYTIIVYIGFLFFIVPGIIFTYMFCLFPFYIIEKGMNPIDALKSSYYTTRARN